MIMEKQTHLLKHSEHKFYYRLQQTNMFMRAVFCAIILQFPREVVMDIDYTVYKNK